MRVLFDIVHPADVLFFYHPIKRLQAKGAEIKIASRKKDVACDLLDEFGLEHSPISGAGSGTLGLASELVRRDFAMLYEAVSWRPDVMIGLGGISIAHAGWLTRRTSLAFYMADTAKLQTRLTWPFITHLFVPETYSAAIADGRTTRFPGIKELSYFHPENFEVDESRARSAGWDDTQPNFFVRTVKWGANHDIGKSGWSDDELGALLDRLSTLGKVHLSSERPVAQRFQRFLYQGAKSDLHHLLAKCRLYVGESATMAHEAALLGCPGIYDGPDHPGTTRSLAAAGLVEALRQPGEAQLLATVEKWLSEEAFVKFDEAKAEYIASFGNLADYIVDQIVAFGERGEPAKE
ncbi:MAG: DUF354 domain-containing protein [Pseudomonadota bacterium]|nr:DUF354 domain-containing protein [Pseudomonadota bacterium]